MLWQYVCSLIWAQPVTELKEKCRNSTESSDVDFFLVLDFIDYYFL